MYRLSGSVGQGGRNAHDDVQIVQVQLNKNAHLVEEVGRVPEDGNLDEVTQRAIMTFQRDIVRLSSPDGRIDPRGRTWRVLLGDQSHGTVGAFTQILADNGQFYLYSNTDRVWGTPTTIQSVRNLAAVLAPLGIIIGVGDISFAHGGHMAPHSSHRRGVDVDIRPQRTDQAHLPVTITDPDYSHERTKQVVEAAYKDDNLQLILFNDNKITGVRHFEGHHNHLHMRFKE